MAREALHVGVYDHDDDLIAVTRGAGQAHVRVYAFDGTAVVLGRGSRPEVELHLEHCVADGVPVLRRHGGGCAVVLDPGNVVVAAALPVSGILGSRRYFDQLSAWLIEGLARTGIPGIYRDGICDLVRADQKIGGACIHRSKDLLFYSATLLVRPDLAKVERYLRHPPREPEYRRGRPHGEFMGMLADVWPCGEAGTLAQALGGHLSALDH